MAKGRLRKAGGQSRAERVTFWQQVATSNRPAACSWHRPAPSSASLPLSEAGPSPGNGLFGPCQGMQAREGMGRRTTTGRGPHYGLGGIPRPVGGRAGSRPWEGSPWGEGVSGRANNSARFSSTGLPFPALPVPESASPLAQTRLPWFS